ncbi:hypothetical protein NY544_00160, partial [Enterobacter hormaechei]|uniref:hypothetical protein n=1 Tax=Enterobacter hormaechei TaxID=158836 RepID=UPI0022EC7F5E
GHGMACALYAHGAKVHGQHVEGGFRTALDGGGGQGGKAVHTLGLHGLYQHGAGGAAREWLDQSGGQGIDKAC